MWINMKNMALFEFLTCYLSNHMPLLIFSQTKHFSYSHLVGDEISETVWFSRPPDGSSFRPVSLPVLQEELTYLPKPGYL